MQIVIDIPEQDYVYIAKKHCLPSCDDRTLRKIFYEMVENGTPLPKGHGRLIDADAYIVKHEECGWLDDITVDEFNAITPTIIEADTQK